MKYTMANSYFRFKQFTVHQDKTAMKVTTDACLFGAWAAQLISELQPAPSALLDIGTGTGLLSLMAARKNPGHFDAVEIDEAAARQAAENKDASPWADRIQVHHADIKNFSRGTTYDVILSNPPFYEQELEPEDKGRRMAHHGSSLLLAELFSEIKSRLKEDGVFFLLFPFKREKQVSRLLEEHQLYTWRKLVASQSMVHPPFRFMIAGGLYPKTIITEEIAIIEKRNEYTGVFKQLLSDYYLNL